MNLPQLSMLSQLLVCFLDVCLSFLPVLVSLLHSKNELKTHHFFLLEGANLTELPTQGEFILGRLVLSYSSFSFVPFCLSLSVFLSVFLCVNIPPSVLSGYSSSGLSPTLSGFLLLNDIYSFTNYRSVLLNHGDTFREMCHQAILSL